MLPLLQRAHINLVPRWAALLWAALLCSALPPHSQWRASSYSHSLPPTTERESEYVCVCLSVCVCVMFEPTAHCLNTLWMCMCVCVCVCLCVCVCVCV